MFRTLIMFAALMIAGPALAMAPKPTVIPVSTIAYVKINSVDVIEAARVNATAAQKTATEADYRAALAAWEAAKLGAAKGSWADVNNADRDALNAKFRACKVLTCG